MSNKSKNDIPSKPRNSSALNPLMRKSHVHSTPKKTSRAKDKQALKKELAKD